MNEALPITLIPNSSVCPRCKISHAGRFYGPCAICRGDLQEKWGNEGRQVKVAEYEPKMNVTPNAVASKDD